jgi:hypothetical protein
MQNGQSIAPRLLQHLLGHVLVPLRDYQHPSLSLPDIPVDGFYGGLWLRHGASEARPYGQEVRRLRAEMAGGQAVD